MPTSYLLIKSLQTYSSAFKEASICIEGETAVNLHEMAQSFSNRLLSLFLQNENGSRPFWGSQFPFANDPHWKNCLLFHEYFHGDTGRGLGALHQSGWTSLIANLIDEKYPRCD